MPIRNYAALGSALLCLTATGAAASEIDSAGLFAQLDANADGRLTRQEAGDEHRFLFRRLVRTGDENRDGVLSADEFATALIPVRAEKAGAEKPESRIPGADALVVMLARMDVDGDLQLDRAEIPREYLPLYERMAARGDDDNNGRLDARELARGGPRLGIIAQLEATRMGIDVEAALKNLPEQRRTAVEGMDAYPRVDVMMADPAQAGQLFNRLDANDDKQLTADEAPGPLAERFAAMLTRGDRDGDEQLNKREFLDLARRFAAYQNGGEASPQSRQMSKQLLDRFDADGDDRLSREEAPRRLDRAFDRVDANGDALLDAKELAAAAALFGRTQAMAGGAASDAPPADRAAKPDEKSRESSAAKKARRVRKKQGS